MSEPLVDPVVVNARVLVADRTKRARGKYAVDARGKECDACGAEAVRSCAVGALIRAAFELTGNHEASHRLGWRIAGMIERVAGLRHEGDAGYGLAVLCDTRGQAAVLWPWMRLYRGAKLASWVAGLIARRRKRPTFPENLRNVRQRLQIDVDRSARQQRHHLFADGRGWKPFHRPQA
jgi:hypothetical protein